MRFFLFLLLIMNLYALPVFALTSEEFSGEKTMTIQDYIKDYIDIPEGAVDWKVFGTTKEEKIETVTDDGYDLMYSKPEFEEKVLAMDGQEIIIKGYMFPLGEDQKQKEFLFGPFPLTCPFQYHVGPSLVIEVHADGDPVKFDYDPVTLKGTLEIVEEDPQYSIFYRLKNARAI